MSTPMSSTTTAQDVADFRRNFAAAMVQLSHRDEIADSPLARRVKDVSGAKLAAPAGSDAGVEITVAPEVPFVSKDVKFSDLNEAAKSRLLAHALQTARRNAYDFLRTNTKPGGAWKLEDVMPHLTALGLPEPTSTTDITGYVYDEDGDEVRIDATVPGIVSQETAEARLNEVSKGSRSRNMTLEAFPAAAGEGGRLEELSYGVSTNVRTNWPDTKTITVAGAEQPEEETSTEE